jgi:hypothetical protein
MLSNFRTFQLAVEFHRSCRSVVMPHYLKLQLLRASSSQPQLVSLADHLGASLYKLRRSGNVN